MPEIDVFVLRCHRLVLPLLIGVALLKPAIASAQIKPMSTDTRSQFYWGAKQAYLPYSVLGQPGDSPDYGSDAESAPEPPPVNQPETAASIQLPLEREISNPRLDALQHSLELANEIENDSIKAELLLRLATQFIQAGLNETGQELGADALELIRALGSAQSRVDLLLKASQQQEQVDQPARAIAYVNEALDSANAIDNARSRAIALVGIAERYADLLEPALVANALVQATAATDRIDNLRDRSSILAELALQYADLGQYEQSSQLVALGQQALADAAIADANQTPLQPTDWAGNVGLAGNFFSGADRRGIFTFSLGAERQWERDAFRTGLRLTYDVDSDRTDRDQLTGQFTTDGRHYFSNRWQYFVSTQVRSDDLENLNLGANLTTGLGINVWRAAPDRSLDLQVGVGARYENFRDEDEDFDPISANFGFNYQDLLFETFRFGQSLSVDLPVGDFPDYLIQSQTTLRIPITDEWSFENLLRLTYTGEPAENNPNLIFNLQTGIRYDF